ncbi:MAG: pyridoxal 5'-phosphate synthase, partial [Bacteroidetes bacterium]|nr:pyridoxal 5'-phosphate synthase [Bacteroidota bacterium]
EKVSEKESDDYFKSRPFDHRIGAWASPQSQVISSRSVIEKDARKFAAEYPKDPPRPKNWGGYRLKPELWEFWQGRKSRLHDRLRYLLEKGKWRKERLAP